MKKRSLHLSAILAAFAVVSLFVSGCRSTESPLDFVAADADYVIYVDSAKLLDAVLPELEDSAVYSDLAAAAKNISGLSLNNLKGRAAIFGKLDSPANIDIVFNTGQPASEIFSAMLKHDMTMAQAGGCTVIELTLQGCPAFINRSDAGLVYHVLTSRGQLQFFERASGQPEPAILQTGGKSPLTSRIRSDAYAGAAISGSSLAELLLTEDQDIYDSKVLSENLRQSIAANDSTLYANIYMKGSLLCAEAIGTDSDGSEFALTVKVPGEKFLKLLTGYLKENESEIKSSVDDSTGTTCSAAKTVAETQPAATETPETAPATATDGEAK